MRKDFVVYGQDMRSSMYETFNIVWRCTPVFVLEVSQALRSATGNFEMVSNNSYLATTASEQEQDSYSLS